MKYLLSLFLLSITPWSISAESIDSLSLKQDGKVVMTYNVSYLPSPDESKPWFGRSGFIHPVRTPSGRTVTAGFPPEHMHQHGLMFAWTNCEFEGKPIDFWNSRKKQGRVEHAEIARADDEQIAVKLRHVKTVKQKTTAVLNESWEWNLVPHDSMHVFDLVSTQSCATDQPLIIREYHYGGMCVRGPSSWNSADVMLTSEGKKQSEGNHTRPSWVAMFGEVDGEMCGIAAMSHPNNFRAPQPVRLHQKMPYFCFAPMVLGEFTLDPGTPYVSRFRFVAFDGQPDTDELNAIWKTFSNAKQ